MDYSIEELRAARDHKIMDDARKIDAFDDLLSALQALMLAVSSGQIVPYHANANTVLKAFTNARAAIAKATRQV